ncbi:MAG: hypothetical protein LBK64_05230 [Spirochaetaceae bacterium]|jgi:hypothetical protein|nr:hypothetical protein [Spirochaetaceae bacterium]
MIKADTSAEKAGYSGKIPEAALIALEWELAGLIHGTVSLVTHVRDGKLIRFTTGRERSCLAEDGNGE